MASRGLGTPSKGDMRSGLIILLAMLALADAQAQARPDCPTRPRTLAAMRSCYRPLLVFAPSSSDPRLATQRDALDHDADDMMDRNVLLVPVIDSAARFQTPLDAPFVLLGAAEVAAARKRYGVAPDSFQVVLLGEDGGPKLRSRAPVPVDRLNGLIDTMPTRKIEMQRPHAN